MANQDILTEQQFLHLICYCLAFSVFILSDIQKIYLLLLLLFILLQAALFSFTLSFISVIIPQTSRRHKIIITIF